MMEKIFDAKVDHDERNNIILIQVNNLNKVVALRLPSICFWLQLLTIASLAFCVGVVFAYFIYKTIISHPKSQGAFLVGYGIIIPICLYIPYALVEYLNLSNIFLRLFLALPFVLYGFRTSEAMYGFSPKGSIVSLKHFIIYFIVLGEVEFNEKTEMPVKPTMRTIMQKILTFIVAYFGYGLLSSIFYHYDFELYDTNVTLETFDLSLVSFGHLMNGLAITVSMHCTFSLFALLLSILTNILYGVEIYESMKNMWKANSLSEFWGKKWNLVVHGLLKRGVYKPMRIYLPTKVAVLSTFLASGLFHEWILSVFYFAYEYEKGEDGQCQDCYNRKMYGMQLLFFMWHGGYLVLELTMGRRFRIFPYLAKTLHPILIRIWLGLVMLPVFHWFYHDYLKLGFFHHCQMSLPTLVLIDS